MSESVSSTIQSNIRLTDRKRSAILIAALAEFKERGYQMTSMDRIASKARVSKRTVYNHFASKEELFGTIVADLFNRVRKTSTIPFSADRPLRDQLLEIADQHIELLVSEDFIELARITFSEYIRSPDLAKGVFSDLKSENPTFLNWVDTGIDQGQINARTPIVPAKQFIAILKSFFLWPQLFGFKVPEGEEREMIINSTIDMFLGYYKASEETDNR